MAPKVHVPLVRSPNALRALAAGITMLSLSGMTVYASEHVHNAAAPLQPAAASSPAPTPRLRLDRAIVTSTKRPLTSPHSS